MREGEKERMICFCKCKCKCKERLTSFVEVCLGYRGAERLGNCGGLWLLQLRRFVAGGVPR